MSSIDSVQQSILDTASMQLSGGIAIENVHTDTPTLPQEPVIKPRTTLPAKYNKFIQFGYFLMTKLNQENTIVDETLFLDKLSIFNTIDSQQSLVQEFFDNSKTVNKTLRKLVTTHKKNIIKANKPQRVKPIKLPKDKKDKITSIFN